MTNIIFVFIFIIGIVYGLATGRGEAVLETILKSPKNSFFIFIEIYTSLIFWGGLLEVCNRSGLLSLIGKVFSIIIKPLFKNLNYNDKALQYISLNIVCNMFSLGSAATPFGLKAMDELKLQNKNSDMISNEMITFLLINVGGFTMIPTAIITILMEYKSREISMIVLYIMVISLICTSFSILLNGLLTKYEKC